jgi:hypothetical protein
MPLSDLAQLVPVEFVRSKASFALLGLLTHHLFHRYEWDYTAHRLFVIWPVALASIGAVEWAHSSAIKAALGTTATAGAVYLGTIVTSILIHRVFFHRLRKVCARGYQPSITRLTSNSSPVLLPHASPNFTPSLQAFYLPRCDTSNTARRYTRNTRATSSEPAQES